MAFSKTPTTTSYATPDFASPAYCKDMLTFLPKDDSNNNNKDYKQEHEGSTSPKSTATHATEACSETDAEADNNMMVAAPMHKRLSVKDRISSLGGSVKEKPTRNISPRNIDKRYAAKLASNMAPKVDIYGGGSSSSKNDPFFKSFHEEKKDDNDNEDEPKSQVPAATTATATTNTTNSLFLPVANKGTSVRDTAKRHQPSVTSAFRRTGPAATVPDDVPPPLALSTSTNLDAMRHSTWQPPQYDADMDRLIDERVQAHVAVIEARMESQLGRFMEQMDRKMELLQRQVKELQAANRALRGRM